MDYMVLIAAFVAVIVIVPLVSIITANKKIKIKQIASFGKAPTNQDYNLDSIESYHNNFREIYGDQNCIDSITWNDLDMDQVFKRINACSTSVGEEYLYHLLHTQHFQEGELIKRERLIAEFKSNEEQRLNIQTILSKLGKKEYNGMTDLLKDSKIKQLKCPFLYSILAIVPIIGVVVMPFNLSAGLVLLVSSFVLNVAVYYHLKRKIEKNMCALEYFGSMLWCCNKICSIEDERIKPHIINLADNFKVFKSISSKIPIVTKRGFSDMDIFVEYIKILFLSDIRNYNKVVKKIADNSTSLKKLYCNVGELDASISILSFRESLPFFCVPQLVNEKTVSFKGLYHPLLSSPIANDADLNRNCIITGSNASGKSTFIKAVAINGILAQTIYTCTAHSYIAGFSLVMTSMAVRDNICEGDSYFITEIKSLKRIIDSIGDIPCLCCIDEILKGTNTIERIAASAAVLKSLNEKNCLCMVASHDIELTEILKNEYENFHFSEQITDDEIHFDYLLKQGPSQTRNAIKLLHFMDFDNVLVEQAEGFVTKFTRTHKWID